MTKNIFYNWRTEGPGGYLYFITDYRVKFGSEEGYLLFTVTKGDIIRGKVAPRVEDEVLVVEDFTKESDFEPNEPMKRDFLKKIFLLSKVLR